jgi:hypothetical protein
MLRREVAVRAKSVWILAVGACSARTETPSSTTDEDPVPGVVGTADTAAPPTGDTGDTVPPATLTATCAPTDNALRFDCTVTVEPPQPVQIRFAPQDGSGPERIHVSDVEAAEHDIGLYLMRPQTSFVWTAETLTAASSRATATDATVPDLVVTDPLPAFLDGAHLAVTGAASVPYVGTHHPCDASATVVVFDTVTGDIVWYDTLDGGGTLGFFDMFQFTEDHTILGETGPSVVEVDLRGRELLDLRRNVDYDEYFHHDLFKRNGHIYAIYQDGGTPTLDGLIVFDAVTGVVVADWAARDSLDIPSDATGDWMHTNTVWVDEGGDIYLSSWTQDSILKIAGDWTQPDFGTQQWALAGLGSAGFGSDFETDYTPVPDDGFRDQHNVSFTPDGKLLMLDNAHGRGLQMTLDEVAMRARAKAEFPTNDWVCGPQGTAQAVTSGNVFVGCSGPELLEYDTAGIQVWSADAGCDSGRPSVVRWYPLEDW